MKIKYIFPLILLAQQMYYGWALSTSATTGSRSLVDFHDEVAKMFWISFLFRAVLALISVGVVIFVKDLL